MKKCYPIELVNRVANKYQDCWNIVEDFRNDSTLPCWEGHLELIIRSRSNSGDCCMEIA